MCHVVKLLVLLKPIFAALSCH